MMTNFTSVKNHLQKAVIALALFLATGLVNAQSLMFEAGRTYYVNGIGVDLVAPKDTFSFLAGTGAPYTSGAYSASTGILNALTVNGIDSNTLGTITILLCPGYTGVEVNQVEIGSVAYISEFRKVLLKPSAGNSYTITRNAALVANASIFRFSGTQYFTIDGESVAGQRNLTFSTPSASNANTHRVIDLISNTTGANQANIRDITIKNVNITGILTTVAPLVPSTYAGVYLGAAASTAGNSLKRAINITVTNCNIQNVQNGIVARGISVTPAVRGSQDLNLICTKNIIGGQANTLIGGATNSAGIALVNQANALVENNVISSSASTTSSGAMSGILLGINDSNIMVNANRIFDIRSGQTSNAAVGIRLSMGTYTGGAKIDITNNVISRIRSVNNVAGILIESTTSQAGVQIINNSINLTGDTLNGTTGACVQLGSTVTGGVTVENNIFVNRLDKQTTASSSYIIYGVLAASNTKPFAQISNNLYDISTGSGWAFIGKLGTTDYASLIEWDSAMYDFGNVQYRPVFADETTLAIANGTLATYANAGLPLLTTDFLGNPRGTNASSIGAYEFTQDLLNANGPLVGGNTYQINGVDNFPTISNGTGSFATLSSVVDYLNTYGTTGTGLINLIFSTGYLNNDTNTIPVLHNYPGASNTRPIKLSVQSGLTVNIGVSSSQGTNLPGNYGAIRLNGVSFFEIDGAGSGNTKALTFRLPNTSTNGANNVIMLTPTVRSRMNNNTVRNCNIIGSYNTSTKTNNSQAGVYIAAPFTAANVLSGSNTEIRVINNFIGAVRYGIYWRATQTVTDQRGAITGNVIGDADSSLRIGGLTNAAGLYLKGLDDFDIDSNIIKYNIRTTSGFRGMEFDAIGTDINSINLRITRNTVENLGSTAGNAIGVRFGLNQSNRNITFTNNFICRIFGSSGTTFTSPLSAVAGIVVESSAAADLGIIIVNNTVHLSRATVDVTSGAFTTAIHFGNNVSGIYSRNNIFSNTLGRVAVGAKANCFAITFANTPNVFDENNANVYYANGINCFNHIGAQTNINTVINSTGDLRKAIVTTPPSPQDGLSIFAEVPFLTDTTHQYDTRFIGHIAQSQFRNPFAVSDITGAPRNFQTSVGALDVAKVHSPLVGGSTYQVNGIMAPPSIASPLVGSFNTINSLFRYINTNGVDDVNPPGIPITIEITAGYTGEGDTLITPLQEFPRMGPFRPITLRPAAGVTATIASTAATNNSAYTATDAVISFKGAQYFIIDGSAPGSTTRDLTIQMPTPTVANINRINSPLTRVVEVVAWAKPCVGIQVRNCNIIGNSNVNTISSFAGIYQGGVNYRSTGTTWSNTFPTFPTAGPVPANPNASKNNANRYINNFIGGARYGVFLIGNTTVANDGDYNNRVDRNIIGGTTKYVANTNTNAFGGVNLAAGISAVSQNNLVIDSNVISNNLDSVINLTRGIEVFAYNGALNADSNITISRNVVTNVRARGAGATAVYGIYLNLPWNQKRRVNLVNNMISGISAPGSTNLTVANFPLHPYGIFVDGVVTDDEMDLNFYHNSINIASNAMTLAGSTSACIAMTSQIRGEIRLQNNLLQNLTTKAPAGSTYAILSAANSNPFLESDNNNYFVAGTGVTPVLVGLNATGTITNYTTREAWAAFTRQDTLSHSSLVPFTGPENLLIPAGTASVFYRAGLRIPSVAVDILNTSRPSTTLGFATIGAHEYVGSYADSTAPQIYDYSVVPQFCSDFTPIQVQARILERNATVVDSLFYSIDGGPEVGVAPILIDKFDRTYEIPGQAPNTYIRYRIWAQDGSGKTGEFVNSDLNSGYNYTTTTLTGLPIANGFDLPNVQGWKVQQLTGTRGWNRSSFGSLSNPFLAPLTGVRAAMLESSTGSSSRLVSPCISFVGVKRPTLRLYVSQNADNVNTRDSIVVRITPGFDFWTTPAKGYTIFRANADFAVPGYKVYDVCMEDLEGQTGIKIGIEGYSRGGGNLILDSVVIFDNFFTTSVTPKNLINCYNKNVNLTVSNADSKYEYSIYDMLTGKVISVPVKGNDGNLTLSGFLNTEDSAYCRILVRNLTSNCTNYMDDTSIVHFRTYKGGPFVVKGAQFYGMFNDGSLFNPDAVRIGGDADYEIVPPSGTTNSDYGTAWTIANVVMPRYNAPGSTNAFTVIPATPSTPAYVRVTGNPVDSTKLYELKITLRILPEACDSIVTRFVRIGNAPDAAFFIPNDTFCARQNIFFENFTTNGVTSLPVAYFWDFGDGTSSTAANPKKGYENAGTYRVSLTARNSTTLVDSVSTEIVILPSPSASFTSSLSCAGRTTDFTNTGSTGTGITYEWFFGNQLNFGENPTVSLMGSDTSYNVRLITKNAVGCTDTAINTVTVFAQPKAVFTAGNVCSGAAVQFVNASTIDAGKNGRINTFGSEWSFGNGDVGYSNSPSYQYPQGGSYKTTLKVISNFGCTDTTSRQVEVFDQPYAVYTVDNTCRGSNLILDNQSTYAGGLAKVKFTWHFGDNSQPSNEFEPVKAYGAIGQYNLKLVVLDTINNCVDSLITRVTVKPSASAEFTSNNGCVNSDIQFTNLSVVPPGVVPVFNWNFGDGATSTQASPTHQYTTGGDKNVVFIVDVDGCRDTSTATVSISNARSISFTEVLSADSFTVDFTVSDPDFSKFEWDFADGSGKRVTTLPTITNVFPLKGDYTVTVTAFDNNGCNATFTKVVKVWKTVGVKNNVLEDKVAFNVYPNPFSNQTNVSFELPKAEEVSLEVFDLMGRKVFELAPKTLKADKHVISIDEQGFTAKSAAYMVRLRIGNDVISRQIIKQ